MQTQQGELTMKNPHGISTAWTKHNATGKWSREFSVGNVFLSAVVHKVSDRWHVAFKVAGHRFYTIGGPGEFTTGCTGGAYLRGLVDSWILTPSAKDCIARGLKEDIKEREEQIADAQEQLRAFVVALASL